MHPTERRLDRDTASKVDEGIRMQRAFGEVAGLEFLRRRSIDSRVATRVLLPRPNPNCRPTN
jgi:hypothetical protein